MKLQKEVLIYDEQRNDLNYLDFVKKEMGRGLVDSLFTTLKTGEKIVKLSDYEYLLHEITPQLRTVIRQHIDITDLVRCGDCCNYNCEESRCFLHDAVMAKDDFCSRGERIEQEDEDGEQDGFESDQERNGAPGDPKRG